MTINRRFIFHTMENIMQWAPCCILISKNSDVSFSAESDKLKNILMLQSWDGWNLQKKWDWKLGFLNEKIYYLRIKERNQNLHKEFLIRLFAGVKLFHRRFCAIFKHTKVDSGIRALSYKSIIAKVLCDFLHLFQGNGRHCNWLSSSCGGDMGWGWGPARSIVTDCIRKILN